MALAPFKNLEDFVLSYPVVPYQFKLLQKVFEAIRKAGATGLHLAQGERSLLDAFQQAVKSVAGQEVGILIPLYEFYPAIENFLGTAVQRTIKHAAENQALEPFDVNLLKVLFLIRYVTEVRGNVDNLVTLCLDNVDAARLELQRKVESSLTRLEKQTLINRSGDVYFYLTSEEQDISREIKRTPTDSSELAKSMGELIFESVFQDRKKHRYRPNEENYPIARISDGYPFKSHTEDSLVVSVVTPLSDEYEAFQDQGRCVFESTENKGQILIRLPDNTPFDEELKKLVRTNKYLRTKSNSTLPHTTRKIHQDLADQNRRRRTHLEESLTEMIADSRFFVNGDESQVASRDPVRLLDEALERLIQSTYPKMAYLDYYHPNALEKAITILRNYAARQTDLSLKKMGGAE